MKEERNNAAIIEFGPSQLRHIMSINDNIDSKSKVDKEKQKKQIMKRQENKKTLKDSWAAMRDLLYYMTNKSGCARKIILIIFDNPNF